MEGNLRKEEHPRFQRAQYARDFQKDQQADQCKHMTGEELAKATEEYLRNNPDSNQQAEETTTVKRKSENEEVKESKAQKTGMQDERAEEEEEEQRRIPKREVEDIDKPSKLDKRGINEETTEETNEETINSKEVTLETIQRDLNISLLQKRKQKQIRNCQYNVKAVAEGQTSRLLRMTTVLPDVDKFHDNEKVENMSTQIAWDDLTGMKLDAGKVKEAREIRSHERSRKPKDGRSLKPDESTAIKVMMKPPCTEADW